ncbi:VOC family protein [Micromonospora thermarum]|uniref:Glyoxalase-like domain-containing protein n=1 Tax=Micromonospora thermarum TaxID=2720024 RepID=A0ABX0Z3I8_9ACTN|nr:VOC family protein [Micromonospora thermarum]NJP31884.1 hypothetical protein [Micromonospora thermarum]
MEMTLQLVIDCNGPRLLVPFWAEALGYVPEAPPGGHETWRDYWVDMGVPEDELPPGAGELSESIVDPAGRGPRIWFQQVPEEKRDEPRTGIRFPVGGCAAGRRSRPRGGPLDVSRR